jgi:hypothetical protein
MRRKIISFAAVPASLILTFSPSVTAQDEKLLKAINNVSYELASCAAYYNVVAACLKVSNFDEKTISFYRNLSGKAFDRSFELGKIAGISLDAQESRFKAETSDQMKMINNSCVNYSSLRVRFETKCEALLTDVRQAVETERKK